MIAALCLRPLDAHAICQPMSTPNLIFQLQDALKQVREKIARYSKIKSPINEQNTKATLVQPVLRALEWDVEDLDDVHMEYKERKSDKPVDYALLLLRSPCAFVEAKALGSSLDDRKWANQIMGYASVAGVEWVVLTDGDEYRIYNSHATVPVDQKLFRSVRISDDVSPAADTLRLLSKELMKERQINRMWETHFVDRQVQAVLQQLFARDGEPDASIVRLLERRIAALSAGEVKASLRRIDVQISCPFTVDFDQEKERRTPSQTKKEKNKTRQKTRPAPASEASLKQLLSAGLIRAPLALFRKYKGVELTATVLEDGSVSFQGNAYKSCSAAGASARGSVVGGTPSTNGWTFWKYLDDDGAIHALDFARQAYLRTQDP